MIAGDEGSEREHDWARARTLERLVPALVHRLNNALAVIGGVFELGERAGERERERARGEIRLVGQVLGRLAVLARRPSTDEQVIDLCAVASASQLLLQPLAENLGIRFEVRAPAVAVPVRADGRLEGVLLVLGTEVLLAAHEQAREPRLLRFGVCLERGRGVLSISSTGVALAPIAWTALEDLARQRGCGWRRRALPRALGLRLSFALAQEAPVASPSRPAGRARRVLLLHGAGEERELVATVLREQGCTVIEDTRAPEQGEFHLALVERELARSAPALLESLRRGERLSCERIEVLGPPIRPAALLGLIRE